jgi:hypothetical protein
MRLFYAPNCPGTFQADPELGPAWRITIKKGGGGRTTKTFWGPMGEHVHTQASALSMRNLYPLPDTFEPTPSRR